MATDEPITVSLRVDGSRVHGELERFPIRVEVKVPVDRIEPPARGLRVRDDQGDLAHELTFDPQTSRVEGWIEACRLAPGQDYPIHLDIGAPSNGSRAFVDYNLFDGQHSDSHGEQGDLLVEGWIRVDEARPEAAQVIAAQWPFAETMADFATYDAGATDGLPTQGFFGAVFDGRHVYFAPQCNNEERHGNALRYDTCRAFDDADAWEGFDAGATDGLVTRGYYGAVFDGRYVYYVPRTDGEMMHRRVLRFDTTGDFRDAASWSARDGGEPISSQGGAFDGRHVYFAPGYHQDSGPTGRVQRYDTAGAFHDDASWSVFDAGSTAGLNCANYDGALYDGRHVYFVPLDGTAAVLRYDPQQPFDEPTSWEAFDPDQLPGSPFGMCVGAVFDGRWIYFTPYAHSHVVRVDTAGPFTDPTSWQVFEAVDVGGLRTRGYDGAAFDGRFVYFIPFWEGDDPGAGFHARTLRYDTSRPFRDPASWQAADGSALAPPNPGGFNGGAFDGRFLYMAPWREDDPDGEIRAHGHVLRLDTAGDEARFQLRLADCGHNGGLGGSVPGPAFLVNCTDGPVTVQAHRGLQAGWHHVAGVYRADGGAELWIDGELAGTAPSRGQTVTSSLTPTVGQLTGGCARLLGRVGHARVRTGPVADGWVPTSWESQHDPHGFLRELA